MPATGALVHLVLAGQTTERLRRREALIAAVPPLQAALWLLGDLLLCGLVLCRQSGSSAWLTYVGWSIGRGVPEWLAKPRSMGLHPPQGASPCVASASPRPVYPRGDGVIPRCCWGNRSISCWRYLSLHGEMFSANPGVLLTSRVRALAKVMGNITR